MNKVKQSYHRGLQFGSAFLMVVLLWLTFSLPLVAKAQEFFKQQITVSLMPEEECSSQNSLPNTTEEKTSSTINEEYLHHHTDINPFSAWTLSKYATHIVDTYVAFHGEMHCPPPELS